MKRGDGNHSVNDGIHNKLSLISGEPLADLTIWRGLRRFAEYVRIDQVSHPSLVETVVLILGKILSYQTDINPLLNRTQLPIRRRRIWRHRTHLIRPSRTSSSS
jgi:hypothetical protein